MNIYIIWFVASFSAAFLCCAEIATNNIAISSSRHLDSEAKEVTRDSPKDDVPNKIFASFIRAQDIVQSNNEETTVLAARVGSCSIAITFHRNPTSFKFTSSPMSTGSRNFMTLQGRNGYLSLVGHRADVCWALRFIREIESQHQHNYEVPLPAELLALRLVETIHDLSFTLAQRVPAVNAVVITSSGRLLKIDSFGSLLDCSVRLTLVFVLAHNLFNV